MNRKILFHFLQAEVYDILNKITKKDKENYYMLNIVKMKSTPSYSLQRSADGHTQKHLYTETHIKVWSVPLNEPVLLLLAHWSSCTTADTEFQSIEHCCQKEGRE